ncbi:MAG: ABC transporter substrate-binding protein [Alphaproteobacteria bacterium]|nr:ABC transporter substrate-binding protein [Alphaproteobacteria bacterium]
MRPNRLTLNRRTLIAAALAAPAIARRAHAAGVSDGEILLGTHLDLTGPVAAGMPSIRFGTQMRIDEANEAGGVNGRKLRLIVEDNGSQPQMAVRATDKLIRSDEVFAIVNPFGSGTNAAVVKRAVDAGVIYFAPWAASAIIRRIGGNSKYLFTTVPNYDTTMATGAGWMIDTHKPQKIGFIMQEGPLGDLVKQGAMAALTAHGMKPVAEASYKAGDIDFSSQVARMQAAGTDLIIIATITRETIGIMAEVKKLGMAAKVLTASPGRTGIVADLGKQTVEGLYGIGAWNAYAAGKEPAEVKAWQEKLTRRHGINADENAILAYAYADWLISGGLQPVGREVTNDRVAAALAASASEHFIFYGPKRFVDGHIDPEDVQIDQVTGGGWAPASPRLLPRKG